MGRGDMSPAEKRLLRLTEAAEYCGVSPSVFERVCPVRPISLAERLDREDKRLLRWNRISLDEWIDRMDGRGLQQEARDWLAEID